MYCEWNGHYVNVRSTDGRLIRKFIMSRGDVRCATVSGKEPDDGNGVVCITLTNGKTEVYATSGRLIRR